MKNSARKTLIISETIFKIITTLLVCIFIGIKLDEHFNTKPLWIIICSVFSLAYVIVIILMLGSKKNEL